MIKVFFLCSCLVAIQAVAEQGSGDLLDASGEAAAASGELLMAVGDLGAVSFRFSGEVALTVGEPLADVVVAVAKGTGLIILNTATMSLDVASSGVTLVAKPIHFSADVLATGRSPETPGPVVHRVVVMTAGDALALARAVEEGTEKEGTEKVRPLLLKLGLEPDALRDSVLVKNDLDRFAQDSEDLVFAVKADGLLLLVRLEDLEQAEEREQGVD